MKPKEKAKELTEIFLNILGADCVPKYREYIYMEAAKKCAAICVDEIWKEMKSHDDLSTVNYFQYAETKSIIEKL